MYCRNNKIYGLRTKDTCTVRPATALFLVPGIYSAIENSVNGGSCYLVSCKFLQMIVL
jgi:hypothetical protein